MFILYYALFSCWTISYVSSDRATVMGSGISPCGTPTDGVVLYCNVAPSIVYSMNFRPDGNAKVLACLKQRRTQQQNKPPTVR